MENNVTKMEKFEHLSVDKMSGVCGGHVGDSDKYPNFCEVCGYKLREEDKYVNNQGEFMYKCERCGSQKTLSE